MDWSEQVSCGQQSQGFDFSEIVRLDDWQAQEARLLLFPEPADPEPQVRNLMQPEEANLFLLPEQAPPVPNAQNLMQVLIGEQVDPLPQIDYNYQFDSELSPTADISIGPPIEAEPDPQTDQIRPIVRPGRSKYNRPRLNPFKEQKPNKKKNVLVFFRNGHRDYLRHYMQTNRIKDHQIIRELLQPTKNYATKQDFQKMYKLRQLQACWHSMFISGYLYEHLKNGRVLQEQRAQYFQTVAALKEAFITKSIEGVKI